MRVPTRRGELNNRRDDGPFLVTAEGLLRLEQTCARLERDVAPLAAEVARLKENGDLSENFEYQDAKHRLRQLHGRIMSMKDRIKRAEVITKPAGNSVQLGSTVVVESGGKRITLEILGSHEADPAHGRISDRSPLGQVLLGHTLGDKVSMQTKNGTIEYRIIEIQ
ncbi:GreA/GreB family elongation factor [Candidatus Uhrbacteria bacterium]|nr:GreA/GreB family elongation factor [Candidatus Uhrbacteria bacterium]